MVDILLSYPYNIGMIELKRKKEIKTRTRIVETKSKRFKVSDWLLCCPVPPNFGFFGVITSVSGSELYYIEAQDTGEDYVVAVRAVLIAQSNPEKYVYTTICHELKKKGVPGWVGEFNPPQPDKTLEEELEGIIKEDYIVMRAFELDEKEYLRVPYRFGDDFSYDPYLSRTRYTLINAEKVKSVVETP